jgi:plastocyanin
MTMKPSHRLLAAMLGMLAVALAVPPSLWAAEVTAADLARVENELREQRTTLMQMLKLEQERSNMLMKIVERCGAPIDSRIHPATGAAATAASAGAAAATPAASGSATATAATDPRAAGGTATISGRVTGKGDIQNVYIYLDGMRSAAKGKTLEIMQKDKQFVPQVAVAVAGTTATFPNQDAIYHNVFSPSPKPFDLGTRRAGDPTPSVLLASPGVVEIDCNIHSRMTAKILVVPNRVFVKVRPDGTFRLEKVPVGHRRIVAWGPNLKPQRRDVEVTSNGANGGDVSFELDAEPPKPHLNKQGLPFGSYKE